MRLINTIKYINFTNNKKYAMLFLTNVRCCYAERKKSMSTVRRVYVEKKPEFAVAAKDLRHEIRHYLGVSGVTGVRVLIRYDVENVSEAVFEKACHVVFAEPPVDLLYRENFPAEEGGQDIFRGVSSPASLTRGRTPRCSASSF